MPLTRLELKLRENLGRRLRPEATRRVATALGRLPETVEFTGVPAFQEWCEATGHPVLASPYVHASAIPPGAPRAWREWREDDEADLGRLLAATRSRAPRLDALLIVNHDVSTGLGAVLTTLPEAVGRAAEVAREFGAAHVVTPDREGGLLLDFTRDYHPEWCYAGFWTLSVWGEALVAALGPEGVRHDA